MELVLLPKATLQQKVPQVSSEAKEPETAEATELKADLAKLNQIIEARGKIIDLAEKKLEGQEVETQLLEDEAKGVTLEESKTTLISQFDVYFEKLKKVDKLQQDVLEGIDAKNEAWKKSVSSNPKMAARSEFFGKLNVGLEAHESLATNLVQGLRFYGDVMSEYLNPLRQQVRDFVVAREHEKKMYMDQITRAIASQTGTDTKKPQGPPGGAPGGMYGYQEGTPTNGGGVPSAPSAPQEVTVSPVVANDYGGAAPMEVVPQPVTVQATPAAPSGNNGEWACHVCTYLNSRNDTNCGMCNSART